MPDPAAEPINAIPGLPVEASARLLALLRAAPAVLEGWLYGSRVVGRHRPCSDIDITLLHRLPDSLRRHVARVGLRLVPPP